MDVAHFVQRYPPALGGSEAYFARLSRHLAADGAHVAVYTSTAIDLEAFWSIHSPCLRAGVCVEEGVSVRRYDLWRFPGRRYLLKPLSLVPHRLWQCLTLPCNPICWSMWADAGRNGRRYDLVHATAFPYAWPIVCGLRLARRLGVPFLLTPFLHLGDPDDPRDRTRRAYTAPAFRYLLHEANRVFVQTEGERAALVDLGVAAEKLVLLGMGVEASECTGGNRAKARRDWQVADDTVVIGHLGNLSVEKGTVDLLEAAQRLWTAGERCVLVLAGPEMANFRRFWERHTPGGRVLRLGTLDDQQKKDFYAGIDLFALPSRSDSFGLVLLEAWANGVPNVAYRAGGVAQVIRDGSDGLLVRCGAIAALAEALATLSRDSAARRRLGQAGQERTLREFRWPDKLARVRRVYEDVVSERVS